MLPGLVPSTNRRRAAALRRHVTSTRRDRTAPPLAEGTSGVTLGARARAEKIFCRLRILNESVSRPGASGCVQTAGTAGNTICSYPRVISRTRRGSLRAGDGRAVKVHLSSSDYC